MCFVFSVCTFFSLLSIFSVFGLVEGDHVVAQLFPFVFQPFLRILSLFFISR